MAKIKLEDILASKTQAKLIAFFLGNAQKEFYQSELKNLVNESLGSLQYELARLKRIEFLNVRHTKIRTYYKLNSRFSLMNEIKKIVAKTGGPSKVVKSAKKAAPKKKKK